MKSAAIDWKRLALEILVVAVSILMLVHPVPGNDYRRYVTDTLHFERAVVEEVEEEQLEDSTVDDVQQLGLQHLRVKTADGQEIELDNYLTDTHNILAKEGSRVIICADTPENAAPYYSLYAYDRTWPLLGLVALFTLLLTTVGRRKGLDAALAIFFTLLFIVQVTVPVLFNGGSPLAMGLVTVVLATAVTLVLMHGPTIQCLLGIAATMSGELIACLLFAVFSGLLHITGFQTDVADGLLLIAQNTGLKVRHLLFAATMISSLGAVMDVAVSILAALREVAAAGRDMTGRALFSSGMRMGQDMIGTMSNTLIFAFTGGALATMLVFYSQGIQFQQLVNSDYLTIELAQGLCSTAAVILTVPAGSAIGAAWYGAKKPGPGKPGRSARAATNKES
jgi:uncharacterized membrane protein